MADTFLNNNIIINIRESSKENNKKSSEITEESLLLHCQNSQTEKVKRCHFHYLKMDCRCHNSFLLCADCFLRRLSPVFKAMKHVAFTPWKASQILLS